MVWVRETWDARAWCVGVGSGDLGGSGVVRRWRVPLELSMARSCSRKRSRWWLRVGLVHRGGVYGGGCELVYYGLISG